MQADNLYWKRQALKTTRRVWAGTLVIPILAIFVCQNNHAEFAQIGASLPLLGLRTIFYLVAILLFPLTRLYRHRPYIRSSDLQPNPKTIAQRFNKRVILSLLTALFILCMGLVLCLLGDHMFSFYLLTSLSLLAIILYCPKASELSELST